MEIHLDDPRHTGDLVAFLQRARCAIERLEDGGLLVRMPGSPLPDAERLELTVGSRVFASFKATATRLVPLSGQYASVRSSPHPRS